MDVQNAYQWIVSNPQVHQTKAVFTINSDWGEIGLLTPSTSIIPDPDAPVDPSLLNNLNFASTKITWGNEPSHQYQCDVTIAFIIKNNGSPVDIELSHGSDGDQPGTGNCMVEFDGNNYQNNGVKGKNWNTQLSAKSTRTPSPQKVCNGTARS